MELTCVKNQPWHCFLPAYRAWDAAILCSSPTAYLAISKWGLAWYWVWIHSREEFSHTLPGNRFIATYPHTVPNSPKSPLMFYFNCLSQPADDKSVLNLQWGFGGVGIEWDFIDIIAKGLFYLFWLNEIYPFSCIKDLSEPICQHPSLYTEQSLCRLLHPQPAECCVLAGALSSTCLHWKSDCREELVLETSCFLFVFVGFF